MNDYTLALKRIGTAFLIFVFNFNIGTLNLIPNFIGYILIYKSLSILEKYEESTRLMKPLTLALTIYSGFTWFFNTFQISFDIYVIDIMFSIFSIYVYYHLLTSIGQICKSYQSVYTNRIWNLRNIITIMQTFMSLAIMFNIEDIAAIVTLLAIVYIIIVINLKVTLNHCSREAQYISL